MQRSDLVETAGRLGPFGADVAKEYADRRQGLVAEVNRLMLERADVAGLVGEPNLQMMQDNHNNHAMFIQSMLERFDAEVLVDTVLWVFRAYGSRGFQGTYWSAQLNAWLTAIGAQLSEPARATIEPLYRWMVVGIPHFTALAAAELTKA